MRFKEAVKNPVLWMAPSEAGVTFAVKIRLTEGNVHAASTANEVLDSLKASTDTDLTDALRPWVVLEPAEAGDRKGPATEPEVRVLTLFFKVTVEKLPEYMTLEELAQMIGTRLAVAGGGDEVIHTVVPGWAA